MFFNATKITVLMRFEGTVSFKSSTIKGAKHPRHLKCYMGNTVDKSPNNLKVKITERNISKTKFWSPGFTLNNLSPEVFKVLRECLLRLPVERPREIKEDAIQNVANHIVIQEIQPHSDIIMVGDPAKGIYFIIEGKVNVMSSSGDETLINLQEGDFFGEVSVLFDTVCTARIQTQSRCVLALLDLHSARQFLPKVNMDITEWFARQRYLPTTDGVDANRTIRRMAFKCLRETSLFEKWDEQAVKTLILLMQPTIVILHPTNSSILMEQDPPRSIFIIIRGRAMLKHKGTDKVDIRIGKKPIVIGEEGMMLGYNSHISVVATTCCEVIQIREEWIHNVINQYPLEAGKSWETRQKKWKTHMDNHDTIYHRYPSILQYEVLFHCLRNSLLFSHCSDQYIEYITLHGSPREYATNETLCTQWEYEDNCVVLLLEGELTLVTESDTQNNISIPQGAVFCRGEWMESKGKIVSLSNCLVFKIYQEVVQNAMMMYPESILTYPNDKT